ncbi:MAG: TlpA family protein disulfide reductase [Azospira oryzae]|uniref:TlpA family protein disulfide reductase n=1 Tax=Pelomicrobium methylotrophicum TaxID=2602750 RepID=A0A5C7ERS8_9PROT|nr:TlpA disulfide reductase family protein [Pelomicrobium methylotrophicum]PZP63496.1 MAG: TlpA family protein disulfide reductase [Azospira oryzae]PZP81999.1 MAG: TlpA family protein disulfide reductase [Azospira oryzae]PZR46760.1 MAG: TlpA family protein disulfide reductase [Stutzerimonas stutzeri]TXF10499.1 TlpA family protein disulfide reductase [Pelomicrobium methylotrophicum]
MHALRRFHLKVLAGGFAAALLAPACWAQSVAQQPASPDKKDRKAVPLPAVGSRFPLPASIELIDGRRLQAQDLKGKLVVLEYWATWCPFCARQMPYMEKLHRDHHRQGLVVLGLSVDKEAADVLTYVKQRGVSFPVAWLSPELARALPKPAGLPVTIVIGRDGRVKMAEAGELFPEDIAAIAKHL